MHAAAGSHTLGISANTIHTARKASNGNVSKKTRFELLRAAQSALFDTTKPATDQKRVVWCNRTMIGQTVPVYRAEGGAGSRLGSLHTCGSVWHCPVCAAKIAEARREELQQAMAVHKARGGTAYLLTVTFPHGANDDIFQMLDQFDAARQSWKNCRTYKKLLGVKRTKHVDGTWEITEQGEAKSIGAVSSLEVTFSENNGWHPHMHMLVFCEKNGLGETTFEDKTRTDKNGDLSSPAIDKLKAEWVRILLAKGIGDPSKKNDMLDHGLSVRGGEYAADYVAKFGKEETWTLEDELTRAHAKTGAAGMFGDQLHFTPFQLLTWAKREQDAKHAGTTIKTPLRDRNSRELFREYANAFEGKRMLTWSPGLRACLKLSEQEKSEIEIAAAPLREEVYVGELSEDQFTVLLTRDAVGDFHRYVAESCIDPTELMPDGKTSKGQHDINEYIESMKERPATHGRLHKIKTLFGGKISDTNPQGTWRVVH